MKTSCTKKFILICCLLISTNLFARDHVIYSVDEEIPMGFENEVSKRNYYVNIGSGQGVQKGTILDVYRIISLSNPYDNKKRVNYKVKIGELEVLHTEDQAAIAIQKALANTPNDPLFEISNFMIGDHVMVSVN